MPKVRDGVKKSEPSAGKERKPGDYMCRDAEVGGELAYSFNRTRKNTQYAIEEEGGKRMEQPKDKPTLHSNI